MTTERKYTIPEIRTFIEAVEYATEGDFIPTEKLWKRLREMVFNVDDTPAPVPAPQPRQVVYHSNPVQMDEAAIQTWAAEQQQLPQPQFSQPAVPSGPSALLGVPPAARRSGFTTNTPSIDTSNGQGYTSSFAS